MAGPVRHSPREFHDFPPGGPWGGQQGLVTFFIENREELELSDEQVAKLKAIRNEHRKVSARINADLQEVEERLSDLMQADEMNLQEIEAASKRIETLEHESRLVFAKAISDGKRVLTPAQRKIARWLREHPRRERS
jgi:Spy/CpxP family protein refolding chaperone